MDFERAALNSVRQVYTNTEFKGCFYHFSSNRWKHIKNLCLQNHYQDDENFALWLRILSALAFVRSNDVIRYFELLIDKICNNFNDECNDLINYFEYTYLGIFFIKFIKWYQGLCTRGASEPCPLPRSPPSHFYRKQNLLKIIQFLLCLLSKSIRNVFLRLQEKLKCKLLFRCQPWWRPP